MLRPQKKIQQKVASQQARCAGGRQVVYARSVACGGRETAVAVVAAKGGSVTGSVSHVGTGPGKCMEDTAG